VVLGQSTYHWLKFWVQQEGLVVRETESDRNATRELSVH